MAQRYIYLPDELNNRLKQEENVSALIVNLLTKHYRYNVEEKGLILENINKIDYEREKYIQQLENEKIEFQKKLLEISKKEQEKIDEENKLKSRKERIYSSRNQYFKEVTGRDMTSEEHEEFNERFQHENINIFEFAKEKV